MPNAPNDSGKHEPSPCTRRFPLAALLLAGCASPLAGKPADLATRQVLRENLQNASYNFSGELGFTSLHGSSADDAKPQLSYTINQVARSTKVAFNGALDQTANGWS
jgi:outer membrane biogenesis lipoprotein LolB